ncbi:cell cycle checkpoint [Wolfiporia cocos MD-104 SS10]|uniref:Checkpoint protein n=1 Tax=Wolfiporia cocos (strain MD-104) TaxID=742152 RepID=A0A2H3JKH6_WOLCO|nr:cell cycle checkpoint [Wolfiporia cocos MD-104 SS10]
MRFRTNVGNIDTFYKILQTVEKLQKRCSIKLTETEMHIICNSDVNEGGIQMWSQIRVPSMFIDYRIQSNANNVILLTVSSEALVAAMRSAATPSSSGPGTLTKKGEKPTINFDISISTRGGRRVRIAHDVPIDITRTQEIEKLKEPLCPEPEVHILLPPLARLRTVVERMKPLAGKIIKLSGNMSGCLTLSAETEQSRVDVSWTGLSNPDMNEDGPSQALRRANGEELPARGPKQMYGVLVSLGSLQKFLNCHVVSTTTIACICQNHCLVLYVYVGEVANRGGVLTFYIPAIIDEGP